MTTVALLAVSTLGLMLASHTPLAEAAGVLTITDLTAPNVAGDASIESKPRQGPEVFTIGAKFCNTGDDTLKDVFAYIGNGTTPGTFPTTTKTAPPYGGTFALQLLDADKSDATRYLGNLAPTECVVVYWQVKYPLVDANGDAVWGDKTDSSDDLKLDFTAWGAGIDAGTSAVVTGNVSDSVFVRNTLTAATNKVQPSPGGYTMIDPSAAVGPGRLITVCYNNVRFGNVNKGFDDAYDLWFQPIGETLWNPDAFRLVRIEAELRGTSCGGGKPDVTLPLTDTTYVSDLDDHGTCIWQGDYCYTFTAVGTGTGTLTAYHEVASGADNEKYNADYGGDNITACDHCVILTSSGTSVELDKTVDKPTATDGETLAYNITYDNTTNAPLGDPDTGNGVVIEDSIPANTTYVAGSATYSAGCTILYSTNGGATWSSTAPADPTTVTDLRWVLNAAVPAHGSGTVGFQVLIDTGFSGNVTNVGEIKLDNGPTLTDDHAITCVNCTPEIQALKTDSLLLDADGDNVPSPGDTLRYTMIIINSGNVTATGVVFTDDPDPNTSLIIGSVDLPQCPGCSVTSGNDPGDTSVGVNAGDLAAGASVEIRFQVTIGADGFTEVTNQGTVGGTNFDPIPTDDPDTTTPDDPTVTPVTIGPPELTITKFGPAEAVVDTTIIYTGTLTNISDSTAYNVVLVDELPDGVTFVGSSHTAVYNPVGNTVTWNLGTVLPGTSIPGWLTVHIDPTVANGTVLTNTFRLTWEDKDGSDYGPAEATSETIVYDHPQLTLQKKGPAEASPEDTFSYKLTVHNIGGTAAQNVVLTDTLSISVTYQSSNPGGTYAAGPPETITWNLGTIEGDGSKIVVVTVKVTATVTNGTTITNTASVNWDGADQPVEATSETTIYTEAELVITKFGPEKAVVDSTITYAGTLANVGGSTAYNAVLVDYLPDGVTFVSSSHTAVYDAPNNTVTWNLGDIPAGTSIPGWLTVHIDPTIADNTILHNTFHVIWEDDAGDPSGSDTAAWDTTVHTHPDLTVEKNGPAQAHRGEDVTYTIRVENIGGTDALNVTLTDLLPTGLTYDSSNPSGSHSNGVVTWDLGTIPAYSAVEVSLTARVDDDVENNTPVVDTVSLTWQDSLGRDQGPATDTHQTTIYTRPVLTIAKIGPVSAYPSKTFTYTIEICNVGGTDALTVTLTDTLPISVTYQNSSDGGVHAAGVVTWTLGTITSGDCMTVTLTVEVDAGVPDGTLLENIADVTWSDADGKNYGPVDDVWETTVNTHPQLTITKTGPAQARQGDEVTYEIVVCNVGGTEAVTVTLQDQLPIGLTYSDSDPAGAHANGVVTWDLDTIVSDTCKTVSLTVTVDFGLPVGTILIDTASVTWEDPEGASYGPATDTAETEVNPALTLSKNAQINEVIPGETIRFTITYENAGTKTLTGVVVTEFYDPNVTFVSATPPPDDGTNNQWTIGELASGDSGNIEVVVRVARNLPSGAILRNDAKITSADGAEAEDPEKTTVGEAPPPPPSVPVGGFIVPVSKLGLLAPWTGLAAFVSIAILAAAVIRRRKA